MFALASVLGMFLLAQESGPAPGTGETVSAILSRHDRALAADLATYIRENPQADDLEQAHAALFERAIANDWFLDHEAVARAYLARTPDGAVGPLARIVATMARAQDGRFDQALADYRSLMAGLGQPEQEPFAVDFAQNLANAALAAGQFAIARQVNETLLERFPNSPNVRQKVDGDLARLRMIGQAVPLGPMKDLDGQTLALGDLKGKFVLIDFWATWCAPCVEDLPRLKALHERYRDRGLEIIGVSLDEQAQPVAEFVRARNVPWRQLHNASCGEDLVGAFAVGAIPSSVLLGPDGKVLRLELRGPALEKALAELMK